MPIDGTYARTHTHTANNIGWDEIHNKTVTKM